MIAGIIWKNRVQCNDDWFNEGDFRMRKLFLGFALMAGLFAPGFVQGKDIVDTAVEAGSFKTLVAAVKAAGLVDTLKSAGPFTVFAPTDEAFAKLPAGTVESLLKPENKDKLIAILTYHVVPGKIEAKSVLPVASAKTVQGNEITLGLTIDNARVVKTDILCSNGVIHVIDAVILPKDNAQSSTNPRQVIEEAVAQGSQFYNHGDVEGCVNTYSATVNRLLSEQGEMLPATVTVSLRNVMGKAEHTTCMDSRAWILRKGLDSAYTELARNR
jgi:transforming growth factor-beta-induced protein